MAPWPAPQPLPQRANAKSRRSSKRRRAAPAATGYAATSLQRVAEEAKTNKRMVLYYFRHRQELLERAVVMLGDRLLSEVTEAVEGRRTPPTSPPPALIAFWSAITGNRGAPRRLSGADGRVGHR
ncbi:MAG: TetR family transcriptional regulator [Solirubrobacterales bacterium]